MTDHHAPRGDGSLPAAPIVHPQLCGYPCAQLCATAVALRHDAAARWIDDLLSLADRAGMREMSVRAYLHQRDLGDGSAIDAARALAAPVDNPHLNAMVSSEGPPLLDDLLGRSQVPTLS